MSGRARRRRQRLRDFEARASFAPGDVRALPGAPWRYLAVHPMADEAALLERLGIPPEQCLEVDAWVRTANDALFFQVRSRSCWGPLGPGEFGWIMPSDRLRYPHVAANTQEPFITRTTFQAALRSLALRGLPRSVRRWMREPRLLTPP